jgi:hypothetical protein
MSAISNRHQFVKLDAKSKPFAGQRLVRVIAKKSKDGTYGPNLTESLCVSVPHLSVESVQAAIPSLMAHIVGMVENAQDSIVCETRKETGADTIGDDEIGLDKVIAYLDAVAKGNRVTSEYLTKWFEDTYALAAAEFISIACKFPVDMNELTPDQVRVVETKTNVLSGMFTGWSSGKYSPDIPKLRAMVKFVEFVGEGADSRLTIYGDKAGKMLETKLAEVSSDALGF